MPKNLLREAYTYPFPTGRPPGQELESDRQRPLTDYTVEEARRLRQIMGDQPLPAAPVQQELIPGRPGMAPFNIFTVDEIKNFMKSTCWTLFDLFECYFCMA